MIRESSHRSHRRRSLSAICALLILSVDCGRASEESKPREQPPNIVLLVMDTTRADHLSLYGWKNGTTPSLEELAADSVVYTTAHSTAPWTLPSHMSMFTGLLPGEHGATLRMFDGEELLSLPQILAQRHRPTAIERMLPVLLRQHGYQTLGISNNPWISAQMGFDTGFDSFRLSTPKTEIPRGDRADPSSPPIPLGADLIPGRFGQTVRLLNRLIETDGLRPPFFLFLNVMDAHYPYLSPPTFRFAFGGNRSIYPVVKPSELQVMAGVAEIDFESILPFYDASILYMDAVIGKLMDWLKAAGWYESSLIIITSDHGEHLGEEGRFSHQLSVEEELLHVPLIIKYPNTLRGGTRDSTPTVSTLDIYATVLSAAGVKRDPGDVMASQNLAVSTPMERSFVLAEYYDSLSYLQIFKNLNPDFDITKHRGAKRVVYAAGRRFVFNESELVEVESIGSDENSSNLSVLQEEVQQWLDDYIQGLTEFDYPAADTEPGDPNFVEALRALGYVE